MSDIRALVERNTVASRQPCLPLATPQPHGGKGIFMRIAPSALLFLLSGLNLTQALAQAPLSIELIDFLVDGRSYIGKRATIIGCQFSFAAADGVACIAFKIEKDTNFPNALGQVLIAGPSLEKESLRRALRNCSDYNTRQECSGDVTGTVFDVFAELGVKDSPILGIKNATIKWVVP